MKLYSYYYYYYYSDTVCIISCQVVKNTRLLDYLIENLLGRQLSCSYVSTNCKPKPLSLYFHKRVHMVASAEIVDETSLQVRQENIYLSQKCEISHSSHESIDFIFVCYLCVLFLS